MEALILAVIITYAIKKAAESAHLHWQSSKAANRQSSRGRPVRKRAASAVEHDVGYWSHQLLNVFPQVRHGLFMGWTTGRAAQLEAAVKRAQAKTGHVQARAKAREVIREQRRRQQEILEEIRAAAEAEIEETPPPAQQPVPAPPQPVPGRPAASPGLIPGVIAPAAPSTEGNAMPGDTTYRQQMAELEAIRASAEQEVSSTRRKLMVSRLDVLQNLGLDAASLAEAAAIDDALHALEKAAQQVLDAADAAISGLRQRHGGIQEAVDDSPVAQPAQPGFYQD